MRVTMLSKALVVGAYQRKCELIAEQPDIELTVLVPPMWRTNHKAPGKQRLRQVIASMGNPSSHLPGLLCACEFPR